MFFSRKVLLLIICSITINNYSMNETNKKEVNQDLNREIVIRRTYNTLTDKRLVYSLSIDFGRYIYAFLKDDNTLWFNFQNGINLEDNDKRAGIVFKTVTGHAKPKNIRFSPKTHTTIEEIKLSNKSFHHGAKIILLSHLKYLKNVNKSNDSYNKNLCRYKEAVFEGRQFYMRPSPSEIIPLNTQPLSDGSGFSSYNNKGEIAAFKRVKLFEIKKKITITK